MNRKKESPSPRRGAFSAVSGLGDAGADGFDLGNPVKKLLLGNIFAAHGDGAGVQLQIELKKLINRLHITTLFVTHDQEEALIMSDRIAIMEAGNIVQCETPITIYDKPATEFVASFIGNSNLIDARGCYEYSST